MVETLAGAICVKYLNTVEEKKIENGYSIIYQICSTDVPPPVD